MASKTPDLPEKRIHQRYSVDFASFAIFRLDNKVLPGLIVDISVGGLAFYYPEEENWPADRSERYTLFGEKCSIEDVPLTVVSDFEVTAPGNPAYDYLILIRFQVETNYPWPSCQASQSFMISTQLR
jgi:hypothetical protein